MLEQTGAGLGGAPVSSYPNLEGPHWVLMSPTFWPREPGHCFVARSQPCHSLGLNDAICIMGRNWL